GRERVFAPAGGLGAALAKNGFRADVAARYVGDFRRWADALLTVDDWLAMPASLPFRHLWLGQVGERHAAVVMPAGYASVEVLELAAHGLAGVELSDKAGEVSRLFREYRRIGSI